jgi:cystathionine beta-lyase
LDGAVTTQPRILGVPLDDLRRDRTSVKWRLFPEDVLPLWVAEMDAAPCEPVVEAVTAAVRRGDTGYAWAPPYAAALARFARDSWGWEIDTAATAAVADVMVGVSELLRLLTDEGGPVVVSTPVYDSFHGFIEAIGRRRVDAPLTAEGRLDPEVLGDAFRSATAGGQRAAYLLCNPHNPTGTLHTAEELAGLAALADEYGVRVVSDEIHAPLTYATGRFTPYLTVPGGERGLTVTSPSKGWNLAGLKAALAVAGSEAVDDLRRLHEVHQHGASHIAVIAHVAALDEGREWLARLLDELDANRRLLADLLARDLPGVRYRVPEATYLAWLDCRELGLGADPAARFRQRGRVALSPGRRFGEPGNGFVRLNLATSPEIITEAVRRMASCLD